MSEAHNDLLALTADIVSSHVSNNTVATSELGDLIGKVYGALSTLGTAPAAEVPEPQKPAVPIRKSVTPDFIICLEDGKQFKTLRRHLMTAYDMTPEEYKAKWGLPSDYPMVAPNYAATRAQLAKEIGLGKGGRQPTKKPQAKARVAA